MVDRIRLIQLIKNNLAMGFTLEQIKRSMLNAGWSEQDIADAMNAAAGSSAAEDASKSQTTQTQQTPQASQSSGSGFSMPELPDFSSYFSELNPKSILIGVIILIVIIGGIVYVPGLFIKSVCGNGKLEGNENQVNCCADAGCPGNLLCKENACTEPVACTGCEYLENDVCVKAVCCKDSDCGDNQTCQSASTKEAMCANAASLPVAPVVQPKLENDVTDGMNFTLNATGSVMFSLEGYAHTMTVTEMDVGGYQRYINLKIESTPVTVVLELGQMRWVDINGDDKKDIEIKFVSYKDGKAKISIKKVVIVLNKKCKYNKECDDGDSATVDVCQFTADFKAAYCIHNGTTAAIPCTNSTQCNDSEASTRDICASNVCTHVTITECEAGDGYCPFGCKVESDADCAAANATVKNCAQLSGKVCPKYSVCIHSTDYDNKEYYIGGANDTQYCCPESSSCAYGDFVPAGLIYEKTPTGKNYIYFNMTSTFTMPILNVYAKVYFDDIYKNEFLLYKSDLSESRISYGLNQLAIKYCESGCTENLTSQKIKVVVDSKDKALEAGENNNDLIGFAVHMD